MTVRWTCRVALNNSFARSRASTSISGELVLVETDHTIRWFDLGKPRSGPGVTWSMSEQKRDRLNIRPRHPTTGRYLRVDLRQENLEYMRAVRLDGREMKALVGLILSETGEQTAGEIDVSEATLNQYRADMYRKLQVSVPEDAILVAVTCGLLDHDPDLAKRAKTRPRCAVYPARDRDTLYTEAELAEHEELDEQIRAGKYINHLRYWGTSKNPRPMKEYVPRAPERPVGRPVAERFFRKSAERDGALRDLAIAAAHDVPVAETVLSTVQQMLLQALANGSSARTFGKRDCDRLYAALGVRGPEEAVAEGRRLGLLGARLASASSSNRGDS